MNAVMGFLLGMIVCAAVCGVRTMHVRRKRSARIDQVTDYLEGAALGQAEILLPTGEDEVSRLQDEIGKTVTALHHARSQAIQTKNDYARNLSSIAHQIKTPLAAISLAAQQMDGNDPSTIDHAKRTVLSQTKRLDRLQEDLLLMAKLDAGVLRMAIDRHDAFTLLSVAADNLEELARNANVEVEIADAGAVELLADEHWMCEALINIMKNCIEHSPTGGTVYVEYRANPLYAEIEISDDGTGFEAADEARLFQRFYTGKRSRAGGTGLGLAFARELIELQNGSIQARNRPEGGACFSIRLYCHPDVTLDS